MKEEEFERLLKITRLKLSHEEKVRIKKDIDEIIAYFDKINSLNASGDPAYQPINVPGRFREDIVKEFKDRKGLMKGTKLHESYILGPKL